MSSNNCSKEDIQNQIKAKIAEMQKKKKEEVEKIKQKIIEEQIEKQKELIKKQQLINKNKFNPSDFIKKMLAKAKALQCDEECKFNKKSKELKQKYIKSLSNLEEAPEDLIKERYNYYSFINNKYVDENPDNLNILQREERKILSNLGDKEFKKRMDVLNKWTNNIQPLINSYSENVDSIDDLQDLNNMYIKENKNLSDEINKYKAENDLSNRKYFYEDEENTRIKNYKFYILIFYYTFFLLYFILGPFLKDGNYKNITTWIFFICVSILPLVYKYLELGFIYIYNKVFKFINIFYPNSVYLKI